MKPEVAQEILERLCRIEESVRTLIKQHAHTLKFVKEIKKTMATKEELNAALDAVSAEITKLGDDLAARLAELTAQIAAGSDVTDSLAKANAIAAKLQSIDDTLPERPPAP